MTETLKELSIRLEHFETPARVYICGDRATCWRHDIPEDERTSGTTAAHAWFVWERGQPPGTQLHRIYKPTAGEK